MTIISFQLEEGIELKRSELLPEGQYPAQITDVKQEISKFNGEQMTLIWTLLENSTIQKDNFYLWHMEENKRKSAQIKFGKLCPAIGLNLRPISGSISLDTNLLMSKYAIIVIKHITTANNVIYAVINDYLSYTEKDDSLPPYPFA